MLGKGRISRGGIRREDLSQTVVFGSGSNAKKVKAVPFDIPIVGYPTYGFEEVKVSTMRLWDAVDEPEITDRLYPNDKTEDGKGLRLKQQFFRNMQNFLNLSIQWYLFLQGKLTKIMKEQS